jgi:hypothetical protein
VIALDGPDQEHRFRPAGLAWALCLSACRLRANWAPLGVSDARTLRRERKWRSQHEQIAGRRREATKRPNATIRKQLADQRHRCDRAPDGEQMETGAQRRLLGLDACTRAVTRPKEATLTSANPTTVTSMNKSASTVLGSDARALALRLMSRR